MCPTSEYARANKITTLGDNEVFVFGANAGGFHGAGAAGLAMRGDSRNNWRDDQVFLRAKAARAGSPERRGKWAVYGVARGYQEGKEGKSYAIETIVRPGARRSTSLSSIKTQLMELLAFAREHPELKFLMTPVGCGYSGYTAKEMKQIWDEATAKEGIPPNMVIPDNLYTGQ